ncbi:MAG: hypothetical protein AAF495_01100 [Pseudomonadota bacterium]
MGQEAGLTLFYVLAVLGFVVYLLALVAAAFLLVRFVYRKSRNRRLAIATAFIFAGILLVDIPLGNIAYHRLCEGKAGIRTYQTVDDVKTVRYGQSICDSFCLALLDRFEALEMELPPGRNFYLPNSPTQPAPGRIRLSRVPNGWASCEAPHWQADETTCVEVEPIEAFSARYLIAPQDWEADGKHHGYGIVAEELGILDPESGELLGEMNAYNRSGAFSWTRLSVLFNGPDQQFCEANPGPTEGPAPKEMRLVEQVFPERS